MEVATRRSRSGFTLIELLIVIAIIAVLTAIALGVYVRQLGRADRAATEALIQMLNDALQDRLTTFYHSKGGVVVTARHTALANGTLGGPLPLNPATGELPSIHIERARLIALLDAMRGDFPQQFIDFMRHDPDPSGTQFTGDADSPPSGSPTYFGLGEHKVSSRQRTAIYLEYLQRTKRSDGTAQLTITPPGTTPTFDPSKSYDPVPLNHDPQTESSECLYLILSVAASEGTVSVIDQIDPRFIKDTDKDGLLEFVDAWQNPIRFYRWPSDYLDFLYRINGALSSGLAGSNALDPNGVLVRTDWFLHPSSVSDPRDQQKVRAAFEGETPIFGGYFRLHALYGNMWDTPPTFDLTVDETDLERAVPYPILPLIVSAGPDGAGAAPSQRWRAFGLAWHEDNSAPTAGDLDIRCARVGGVIRDTSSGSSTTHTFVPDAEMLQAAADNVVSIQIRSGRDN
jgi:prepilin-type N-terminal cleavage/methylation domain-containing protein